MLAQIEKPETIVSVDRSVRPNYAELTGIAAEDIELVYPSFEFVGPTEFNFFCLKPYFPEDWMGFLGNNDTMWWFACQDRTFPRWLNLQDGMAIMEQVGAEVADYFFPGGIFPLWSSLLKISKVSHRLPCLYVDTGDYRYDLKFIHLYLSDGRAGCYHC